MRRHCPRSRHSCPLQCPDSCTSWSGRPERRRKWCSPSGCIPTPGFPVPSQSPVPAPAAPPSPVRPLRRSRSRCRQRSSMSHRSPSQSSFRNTGRCPRPVSALPPSRRRPWSGSSPHRSVLLPLHCTLRPASRLWSQCPPPGSLRRSPGTGSSPRSAALPPTFCFLHCSVAAPHCCHRLRRCHFSKTAVRPPALSVRSCLRPPGCMSGLRHRRGSRSRFSRPSPTVRQGASVRRCPCQKPPCPARSALSCPCPPWPCGHRSARSPAPPHRYVLLRPGCIPASFRGRSAAHSGGTFRSHPVPSAHSCAFSASAAPGILGWKNSFPR